MSKYHPDAISVVADPVRFAAFPALISDAWMRLKDQQGHPVTRMRLERLEQRGHRPGTVFTPAEVIDLFTARALPATRAAIQARGLTPASGGAA